MSARPVRWSLEQRDKLLDISAFYHLLSKVFIKREVKQESQRNNYQWLRGACKEATKEFDDIQLLEMFLVFFEHAIAQEKTLASASYGVQSIGYAV